MGLEDQCESLFQLLLLLHFINKRMTQVCCVWRIKVWTVGCFYYFSVPMVSLPLCNDASDFFNIWGGKKNILASAEANEPKRLTHGRSSDLLVLLLETHFKCSHSKQIRNVAQTFENLGQWRHYIEPRWIFKEDKPDSTFGTMLHWLIASAHFSFATS